MASGVPIKESAAGTSMQICLVPVQVDVMELQSGLLGWQVEKLTKCMNPAAHIVGTLAPAGRPLALDAVHRSLPGLRWS